MQLSRKEIKMTVAEEYNIYTYAPVGIWPSSWPVCSQKGSILNIALHPSTPQNNILINYSSDRQQEIKKKHLLKA